MTKALEFNVGKTNDEVLKLEYDEMPKFYRRFHFHPEIQLTAILGSSGTLFAGSAFVDFEPGDIFLLGSNLPHVFRNSGNSTTANSISARAVSIYFNPSDLGRRFWSVAENRELVDFLEGRLQCVKLKGAIQTQAFDSLQNMQKSTAQRRLYEYLLLMQEIAFTTDKEVIYEEALDQNRSNDQTRINAIIDFIAGNYQRALGLSEVAELSHMTNTSFCRYFRKSTRKSFSQYLCELRVNHASKMLLTTDADIGQIASRAGFNNISNFNRKFKKLKGYTPSAYRQLTIGS